MKIGVKIIASVVSLLLVVGIIIGLVLDSHLGHKKEQTTSTSMKPVTSFCGPTQYKDVCATSLSEVAKNESATPKDFLLAAFNATIAELQSSKSKAANVTVDKSKDLYNYKSVQDCKKLIDYALEGLHGSVKTIDVSDLKNVNELVDELLNYLSGVLAFQTTCLDNFDNVEFKKQIEAIMATSGQLTDNAISIVADISNIFKAFGITIPDTKANQRRLLSINEGNDEFPSWFGAADRELLRGNNQKVPNAVVAQDGSGQFRTIGDAIRSYPKGFRGRYIIYVKAGVYVEKVFIESNQPFIYIYGDGPGRTIVTNDDNKGIKGTNTWQTATFATGAPGVVIKSMTIRNTAGPAGHQAVALRTAGDMTAVFDCSIEGFQDTLYYHTYRSFFRNCAISGTVDFIFGAGAVVIQTSTIIGRNPGKGQTITVTADGKENYKLNTGLVIHISRIVPEQALFNDRFAVKAYLGRPWKAFSTTILLRVELGDFIRPEGWLPWQGEGFHNTANYAEFANVGPGKATDLRDRSFKHWRILSPQDAELWTVGRFIGGAYWLSKSGVPFLNGLY